MTCKDKPSITVIKYSRTCVKRPLSKRLKWLNAGQTCCRILQYIRPSLSYDLSLRSLFCLFLSGRFTQVLTDYKPILYSICNSDRHIPIDIRIWSKQCQKKIKGLKKTPVNNVNTHITKLYPPSNIVLMILAHHAKRMPFSLQNIQLSAIRVP